MFSKILIANRGEIACRIIRTLRRMGIASVAVYSEADRDSLHVSLADEAICVGPAPAASSYLDSARILAAARESGAQAIHPGYGFLSENAAFADACEAAGVRFIGPSAETMRSFGLKHRARELARANGVPLLPGSDLLPDVDSALAAAARIGYPVMLKSTAGGGGIGMSLCSDDNALTNAYASVVRLSKANFADSGVYLEKFVEQARHIEVQIFGDGTGQVIALGERDCSVQRRNQKVIEETPAPGLSDSEREGLHRTAVTLASAVRYASAGTVEFVFDNVDRAFYFLEVNTRLQVEHCVTEAVTGADLVEWMVALAADALPPLESLAAAHLPAHGASMQVRLYAENPSKQFRPSAGLLTEVVFPDDVRVDGWIAPGTEITGFYDPLLAKVIVHADDRDAARRKMADALDRTRIYGIETNLDYLRTIIASDTFASGAQTTAFLSRMPFAPRTLDVLEPGVQTTVQDLPGRLGYWHVGVPPSGPMDDRSFRLANRLVGNPASAAGLEFTMVGATLRFNVATRFVVGGAPFDTTLDGAPIARWQAIEAPAGAILKLGAAIDAGARACLAIAGGIDVPDYLGSRATFTLGQFGGHAGRALRASDVLHIGTVCAEGMHEADEAREAPDDLPVFTHDWTLQVIDGPHGAPDFFTPGDIEMLYATRWVVHYNSSRTGIRLIGPKPEWARRDGGEAGLHPSNIHDNAYAIGAIDFTGDMPVILGPDGPSLGGFVCPVTVVHAEHWKLGQLRPGDTVQFTPCTSIARTGNDNGAGVVRDGGHGDRDCVLHSDPQAGNGIGVVYRPSGDRNVLIEYGPAVLDLNLRFRVHALMRWFETHEVAGIIDLTPGIRSLQVHFDPLVLPRERLLALLAQAEQELPSIDSMRIPNRIVHLPLSWDDPSTRLAIERYMQSVRPDAPWCPSNIEFIRRINGLPSIDDVKRIVFDASYLVLGLGDVYLGAPVATPIDPRHRLVTTKYNPARTWTPENAVGIGGAYLCVYGMEGPGGYQFVGRTVQMWNRYRPSPAFADGKPWLLRFFDEIRFYPVSEQELLALRADFAAGRGVLKIEDSTFDLGAYNRFLHQEAASISSFKAAQQSAFDAERERWRIAGQAEHVAESLDVVVPEALPLEAGQYAVASEVSGSVWKVLVAPGDTVEAGQTLAIVESMKMEIPVIATSAGRIEKIACESGMPVQAGQTLVILHFSSPLGSADTPAHTLNGAQR